MNGKCEDCQQVEATKKIIYKHGEVRVCDRCFEIQGYGECGVHIPRRRKNYA